MAKKKRAEEKKKEVTKIPVKPEIIGGVLVIVVLLGFLLFSQPGTLSPADASEKLVSWLKDYFRAQGIPLEVQLKGVRDVGSVYEVNLVLSVGGKTERATYYVSKDGRYFFPIGIKMEPVEKRAQMSGPPKSDKPTVELFVMSYCPFGMQMEKAIIPVLRLLEDKVDFKLRFVNYAMHGEKEVWENVRQYCIQKEYGTKKLLDYLECFVITKPDNSEACMEEAGIDKNKIEACMEEVDEKYGISELLRDQNSWISGRFPPFPVDDEANLKYGVRGSPTLVINGVKVNVQRSPDAVKQAICEAFTTPPQECEENLDTTPASPGFGEGEGSNISAQCG